jgi:hypothetical protein
VSDADGDEDSGWCEAGVARARMGWDVEARMMSSVRCNVRTRGRSREDVRRWRAGIWQSPFHIEENESVDIIIN